MTIRKQLTTFAAIVVLNTAIDITIYTLLIWLTVPLLLAVIMSTTAGMICSYLLNRRFTFKTDYQPIIQFICTTITGLWVLRPTVIWLLIQPLGITSTWLEHGKIRRHQHQSDMEFCVVPNRISRNKEKTPP